MAATILLGDNGGMEGFVVVTLLVIARHTLFTTLLDLNGYCNRDMAVWSPSGNMQFEKAPCNNHFCLHVLFC